MVLLSPPRHASVLKYNPNFQQWMKKKSLGQLENTLRQIKTKAQQIKTYGMQWQQHTEAILQLKMYKMQKVPNQQPNFKAYVTRKRANEN